MFIVRSQIVLVGRDRVVVLAMHDAGVVEQHVELAELVLRDRDHASQSTAFETSAWQYERVRLGFRSHGDRVAARPRSLTSTTDDRRAFAREQQRLTSRPMPLPAPVIKATLSLSLMVDDASQNVHRGSRRSPLRRDDIRNLNPLEVGAPSRSRPCRRRSARLKKWR